MNNPQPSPTSRPTGGGSAFGIKLPTADRRGVVGLRRRAAGNWSVRRLTPKKTASTKGRGATLSADPPSAGSPAPFFADLAQR